MNERQLFVSIPSIHSVSAGFEEFQQKYTFLLCAVFQKGVIITNTACAVNPVEKHVKIPALLIDLGPEPQFSEKHQKTRAFSRPLL